MPEARKRPRVLHHIVCDDIRREVAGKITLVGCYGNKILTTTGFPGVLPRLCFFFRIGWPAPKTSYRLEVRGPQGGASSNSVLASAGGSLIVTDPDEIHQLGVFGSPFRLPGPGKYRGKLWLGEGRAYTFSFEVVATDKLPGLPPPSKPQGKKPSKRKPR